MTHSGKFELVLPSGGQTSTDEGWQKYRPAFVNAWESAAVNLRTHKIIVGTDSYLVSVDWTSTLKRQKRYHAALRYIYRDKTPSVGRLLKARFPQHPARNPIEVSTENAKTPHFLSIAESVVHDAFLTMNIAAPGCCNFYRASLLGDRIEPNVSMSSDIFDSALYVSLKDGWPEIAFLNLSRVVDWYHSVRNGAAQVPSNPMERVLFALLHLSRIDISPVEVVWLFYAFESLLQTRAGENFSSLVKRLCLLLNANEQQSGIVRRRMRDLYDIRSGIVHGGYEISHPMHDSALDKRTDESVMKILRAVDYGHAFLVAAIQKTILNDWRFPTFDEVISGDRLPS
jgi:hypothetical protein